jgi:hypothetical protein
MTIFHHANNMKQMHVDVGTMQGGLSYSVTGNSHTDYI